MSMVMCKTGSVPVLTTFLFTMKLKIQTPMKYYLVPTQKSGSAPNL